MLNFDDENLRYMGMQIPDHTKETIVNYLFRGWAPGGFVESVFAKDYERALYCADTANRQMFWAIAMWVNEHAPVYSRGSYQAIDMWRDDVLGRRSAWTKEQEQKLMWKTLQEREHA